MKLIALAILSYCLWNGNDLLSVWQGSPFEKRSWILLLLWASPLILYRAIPRLQHPKDHLFQPVLLWSALLATFFGTIGSLNALQHLGIALSLASFLPWSWELAPWIGASLAWLPAFSWFGSGWTPGRLYIIRFSIIAFSLILWGWGRTIKSRNLT